MDPAAHTPSSVEIPVERLGSFLSPDSIADLATLLACHGRHADAWRMLRDSGHFGSLALAMDKSDIPDDFLPDGARDEAKAAIWAPFGKMLGEAIAASAPREDPDRASALPPSLQGAHFWTIQPEAFSRGLAEGLGELALPFALASLELSGPGVDCAQVYEHEGLLRAFPGLVRALVGREAANPKVAKALRGSPGFPLLRGLAGLGSARDLVSEALDAIAESGHDAAACVERRWPRTSELPLPPKLRSSSAMESALMACDAESALLLSKAAPRVDLAEECSRARAVLGVAAQAYPHRQAELDERSAMALSIAESLILSQGARAHPASRKPGL